MTQNGKFPVRVGLIMLLLVGTLALQGCNAVPHQRTLPEWVMRVYVPMADNQSYETGLEEKLTNALIEEILLDGQLDVVQRTQSNAVLRLRILEYVETAEGFAVDDVMDQKNVTLRLAVDMYDPSDLENRVGFVDPFTHTYRHATGRRSVRSFLDVDARDRMAEAASRAILRKVMSDMRMVGDLREDAIQ